MEDNFDWTLELKEFEKYCSSFEFDDILKAKTGLNCVLTIKTKEGDDLKFECTRGGLIHLN